jgi:hypothetical protein
MLLTAARVARSAAKKLIFIAHAKSSSLAAGGYALCRSQGKAFASEALWRIRVGSYSEADCHELD